MPAVRFNWYVGWRRKLPLWICGALPVGIGRVHSKAAIQRFDHRGGIVACGPFCQIIESSVLRRSARRRFNPVWRYECGHQFKFNKFLDLQSAKWTGSEWASGKAPQRHLHDPSRLRLEPQPLEPDWINVQLWISRGLRRNPAQLPAKPVCQCHGVFS